MVSLVFFFVAMIYLLLVPKNQRNLAFFAGILAAVAASTAIFQGFVLWPVGLICLLWSRPWLKRTYVECGHMDCCRGSDRWRLFDRIQLPQPVLRATGMHSEVRVRAPSNHPSIHVDSCQIGSSPIPQNRARSYCQPTSATESCSAHSFLLAAALVVGLSLLERRTKRRLPLPILLITFGVLYDLTVAVGRATVEPGALINRYVMPNLLVLLGIVVYALAHIPSWRATTGKGTLRYVVPRAALATLAILLIIQSVIATRVGIEIVMLRSRPPHTTRE